VLVESEAGLRTKLAAKQVSRRWTLERMKQVARVRAAAQSDVDGFFLRVVIVKAVERGLLSASLWLYAALWETVAGRGEVG